jgi:hypothetical protein
MSSKTVKALSIIFLLAFAGNAIWLYEVVKIVGWQGLTWLNIRLYSPYFGCLLAACAYLVPFLISRRLNLKNIFISMIILFSTNLICFELGKGLCYSTFAHFPLPGFSLPFKIYLLDSVLLYLFLGLIYKITTGKFIKKSWKVNMLFIALILVFANPLSIISIEINSGYGTGTSWIDAIKMGYPIFWTTILLGISGILIERQPDFTNN